MNKLVEAAKSLLSDIEDMVLHKKGPSHPAAPAPLDPTLEHLIADYGEACYCWGVEVQADEGRDCERHRAEADALWEKIKAKLGAVGGIAPAPAPHRKCKSFRGKHCIYPAGHEGDCAY